MKSVFLFKPGKGDYGDAQTPIVAADLYFAGKKDEDQQFDFLALFNFLLLNEKIRYTTDILPDYSNADNFGDRLILANIAGTYKLLAWKAINRTSYRSTKIRAYSRVQENFGELSVATKASAWIETTDDLPVSVSVKYNAYNVSFIQTVDLVNNTEYVYSLLRFLPENDEQDITVITPGKGIVLTSPDGLITKRLAIDNTGAIIIEDV